jgi:hypothetical protein
MSSQVAEENIWTKESDGGRRELHNEELHNLYSSRNIIRMIKTGKIRCSERVARMGEKTNVYRTLVGKPEGKRALGRPGPRWVDSVIGWDGMNWIDLAQNTDQWRALVNTIMNLRFP